MSKLLAYYFKRDKWILLAMALVPALGSIVLTHEMGPFINIMLVNLTFIVSALILIYRDYKRFYGEYSSFFSGLPLTGKEIITGRMLWFVLVGLFRYLIVGAKVLEVYFRMLKGTPGITEFWNEIGPALSQMPGTAYVVIGLSILLSPFFYATAWLFVASVGSEKALRRFGIGGPIMLFVAVQVVYGFLSSAIYRVVGSSLSEYQSMLQSAEQGEVLRIMSAYLTKVGGIGIVIMVVFIIGFYMRSVYSHERKLSAQ